MKSKLTYLLYILALIIVIIPIVLEQSGNPLEEGVETLVLISGLAVLAIGKVISAFKRRAAGEGGLFHDVIIIVCLIGVGGYLLYQSFM